MVTELKEVVSRDDVLINELTSLWEQSVKASHKFLNDEQIAQIKTYVPMAIKEVEKLVVAYEECGIVGFMGINDKKLEMIFLDPKHFSQGIGTALVKAAISKYGVNSVDVNEDNPKALRFYEHMGFEVVSRSPLDEQGQPYPILSMLLQG